MMRNNSILVVLLAIMVVVSSGFSPGEEPARQPLIVSDTLPLLNQKVVDFVSANLKKKVGRGECWDLAAQALDEAGAEWDGKYEFGRLLDPGTENILPGDIVQFENVRTRDKSGNVAREERMVKHTAVVYRVLDKGVYDIAHQNTDKTGKKVGVTRFLLDSVVQGKVMFYRPS